MSYNLDDNVQEQVDIILNGHTYHLRYPTAEEVFSFDEEHKDDKNSGDAFQEWIYSLVSTDGTDTPPIKDVLRSKNIKVMQRFNKHVRQEFGLEG